MQNVVVCHLRLNDSVALSLTNALTHLLTFTHSRACSCSCSLLQVTFPKNGTVFDWYIDPEQKKWCSWTDKIPQFEYQPGEPLSAAMVHTAETTRVRFFVDMLVELGKPVMFVGAPGTGKTAVVIDKLKSMNPDDWALVNTGFNHYSIHHDIQVCAALSFPLFFVLRFSFVVCFVHC